jgi:hypothetical protein
MSELLEPLHLGLRYSHIVLGFAGLALFWAIVSLKKGTPIHRRVGMVFFWIALWVGGSALVGSVWALVHVESYAPWLAHVEPEEQAEIREFVQFIFVILLFLSSATITGAVFGANVMRCREQHERLRTTSVPFWGVATGAIAAGMIAFGVYKLAVPDSRSGALPWAAYQVPVILGLIGVFTSVAEGRYVFGPRPGPREWLYKHVKLMLCTGIAFHTAFLVFGANRLTGYSLSGIWTLIPWVVPPVVGWILTFLYIRRLRRQNGDLSKSAPSSPIPSAPAGQTG